MSESTKRKATSEDLHNIQEGQTREVIGGELIVTREPSWKRHLAATILYDLLAPYHLEEGSGAAGWVILLRPTIGLGDSLLVPDLAGWKKDRLPAVAETNRISVVPDWICEILSESTVVMDKTRKMPIYAQHGLPYLWLIDPQFRALGLLGVYRLEVESRRWTWLGGFFENDKVKAEPFHERELELGGLLHKLAVIGIKRRNIPKSDILSRLIASLEAVPSGTKPEDEPPGNPTFPR